MLDKLAGLLISAFVIVMVGVALFYILGRDAVMCYGDLKWRRIVFHLPDKSFLPEEYIYNTEYYCEKIYDGLIFIVIASIIYFFWSNFLKKGA